jgi:hypothetical protein
MFRRLTYSSGIMSAALITAISEAIRTHWFSAGMTAAFGLLLVVIARLIQQAWYFRHYPAERAAWQAAPPPPVWMQGPRLSRLRQYWTWPPGESGDESGGSGI